MISQPHAMRAALARATKGAAQTTPAKRLHRIVRVALGWDKPRGGKR